METEEQFAETTNGKLGMHSFFNLNNVCHILVLFYLI